MNRELVRSFVLVVASLPAIAVAQGVGGNGVPVFPNVPPPPTDLNPGEPGNQAPPVPQPTQPATPSAPVIVVGPDGKVTYGQQQQQGPTGYYVDDNTYDQPSEIHSGPVPELHVVRSGDTLWGICWTYFNDPWQWPKIWSYNAQITNPHWIYPGDLVRLLPRGVFNKPTDTQPEKHVDLPPPARKTEVGIKQVAFIEQSDLDKSMSIEGGVDEKYLMGDNDSVYIGYPSGKPPAVGQRYTIYDSDTSVKGPNGKAVGAYVRVLGTVEVVSVKEDKHARGVIVEANHEIERGAKIGALLKTFKTVPPSAPNVDAQGNVVAMLTSDQLIGQGEVIFVDLGKGSGVEVGNRMFVVRRGDAYPRQMDNEVGQDDRKFPARALGEIVIVEVGDNISVGLVTLSIQEMSVGDIVMMQKAK